MAAAVRMADGRFQTAQRAYDKAVEARTNQLTRLFAGAGVSAATLAWGHSGELSHAALAKIINHAVRSRILIDEIDPHRYGLVDPERRRR